jgi:hypothetical protein
LRTKQDFCYIASLNRLDIRTSKKGNKKWCFDAE